MFEVSQRCDTFFTGLTPGSGQQEDRESLNLAAELSTAEPVEENIECQHGPEEDGERIPVHEMFARFLRWDCSWKFTRIDNWRHRKNDQGKPGESADYIFIAT